MEFDRTKLLQTLLQEADLLLARLNEGGLHEIMGEWNKRCTMFGKPVTLSQGDNVISGTALSLNDDGGLVVKTDAGQSTFYAGDVTVIQ